MKKRILAISLSLLLLISMAFTTFGALAEEDTDINMDNLTASNPGNADGDTDIDMSGLTGTTQTGPSTDPVESKVIDFETQYSYDSTTLNMEQLTTGGEDNSGSLHIKSRSDTEGSQTFLNWKSIVTNKNDPTFVSTVLPNTTYKVTFKVKFAEQRSTSDFLVLYFDYYSNNRTNVYYNSVTVGEWKTYTANVTTGEDQTLLGVTFRSGLDHPEMWFDNISIEKVNGEVEVLDPNPVESKIIDFEKQYSYDSTTLNMEQLTTGGVDNSGSLHVKSRSDTEGSQTFLNWKSIVTDKNNPTFVSTVLPNSTYKVTFKVKFAEQRSTSDFLVLYFDYFSNSRSNVYYNSVTAGEWKTYTGTVVTGEDQTLLGVTFRAGLDHPEMWFDNITIQKVENLVDPNPVESKIIDFEKQYDYDSTTLNMEQLTTGGVDNSGSLHIKSRNDTSGSQTFLNWTSIATNKNDPTFVSTVLPDSQYLVSVKIKFTEQRVSDDYLALFFDYYSDTRQNITYNNVEVGEWVTYKKVVTTGSDQTKMAFTFRAGLNHPEFYVDNVTITKKEPTYSGPQTDVLIDFEDTDKYIFEQPERMYIDSTTGHTGEETNALLFEGGSYSTATFINWTGITNCNDDIFCIPVEPNSYYNISMWVKVEDDDTNYGRTYLDLFYNYEGYGDTFIMGTNYRSLIGDLKGDWVKYEASVITRADQDYIRITVNATKFHPNIWVDDITLQKQLPGYVADTEASYTEDYCNIVLNSGYQRNGTVTEKTVYEFENRANIKHTFGGTFTGNGTVTLAFDKEGTNVIKKISVTSKTQRTGFDYITDASSTKVYIIFEPAAGSSIAYTQLDLFETYAVSLGYNKGYSIDPALTKANEYNAVVVDQTAADYVPFEESEAAENGDVSDSSDSVEGGSSEDGTGSSGESDSDYYDGDSPETGDTFGYILAIIFTLVPVAVMTLATFIKKKRFN